MRRMPLRAHRGNSAERRQIEPRIRRRVTVTRTDRCNYIALIWDLYHRHPSDNSIKGLNRYRATEHKRVRDSCNPRWKIIAERKRRAWNFSSEIYREDCVCVCVCVLSSNLVENGEPRDRPRALVLAFLDDREPLRWLKTRMNSKSNAEKKQKKKKPRFFHFHSPSLISETGKTGATVG